MLQWLKLREEVLKLRGRERGALLYSNGMCTWMNVDIHTDYFLHSRNWFAFQNSWYEVLTNFLLFVWFQLWVQFSAQLSLHSLQSFLYSSLIHLQSRQWPLLWCVCVCGGDNGYSTTHTHAHTQGTCGSSALLCALSSSCNDLMSLFCCSKFSLHTSHITHTHHTVRSSPQLRFTTLQLLHLPDGLCHPTVHT